MFEEVKYKGSIVTLGRFEQEVGKKGYDLLQEYSEEVSSDVTGKNFRRKSEDNGKTWSKASLIYEPKNKRRSPTSRRNRPLL